MINALEMTMLAAFSIGWYFSIFKMLRTGNAAGKSMSFILLVFLGYACGTAAKALHWAETGDGFGVMMVFAWNALVVAADAALLAHLLGRGPQKGGLVASAPGVGSVQIAVEAPAAEAAPATGFGQASLTALDWLAERDRRYRERAHLRSADPKRLKDIGIGRSEIDGLYRL